MNAYLVASRGNCTAQEVVLESALQDGGFLFSDDGNSFQRVVSDENFLEQILENDVFGSIIEMEMKRSAGTKKGRGRVGMPNYKWKRRTAKKFGKLH